MNCAKFTIFAHALVVSPERLTTKAGVFAPLFTNATFDLSKPKLETPFTIQMFIDAAEAYPGNSNDG